MKGLVHTYIFFRVSIVSRLIKRYGLTSGGSKLCHSTYVGLVSSQVFFSSGHIIKEWKSLSCHICSTVLQGIERICNSLLLKHQRL